MGNIVLEVVVSDPLHGNTFLGGPYALPVQLVLAVVIL